MRLTKAIRAVALIEAAKGALILLLGCGLFALTPRDVQRAAEELLTHAHLNPAARYPRIFLDWAGQITDGRLLLFAAGAAAYASARFIESYGLWHERRWAEWFAALGAGIYIPFEMVEIYRQVSFVSIGALLLNAGVVVLMAYRLLRAHRGDHAER